jgi:hypothetical protein
VDIIRSLTRGCPLAVLIETRRGKAGRMAFLRVSEHGVSVGHWYWLAGSI